MLFFHARRKERRERSKRTGTNREPEGYFWAETCYRAAAVASSEVDCLNGVKPESRDDVRRA